jgi:hypothetical protein
MWYRNNNETLTFTFPDSSDVEDDEYEVSDDEDVEVPSSDDGISVESPPLKASQFITAIDLTEDDAPAASSTEKDITPGLSSVKMDLVKKIASRPADITQNTCRAGLAIIVDSEDEDAQPSFKCDSQLHEMDPDEWDCSNAYSLERPESSKSHDMNAETHPAPGPPQQNSQETAETGGLANLGSTSRVDVINTSSPIGSPTGVEISESIMSEYDSDSDLGLSDAGEEGIRALLRRGPSENGDAGQYNGGHAEDERNTNDIRLVDEPTKIVASHDDQAPEHITFTCQTTEEIPRSALTPNEPFDQPSSSIRQPSPSDAAMVKAVVPQSTPRQTAKHVPVHHLPSKYWRQLTTQSLGDKTGKHEFFEAREGNKAKFQAAESGVASTSLAGRTIPSPELTESLKSKSNASDAASHVLTESLDTIDWGKISLPAIQPLPYLDNHTQVPIIDRDPSPLPDMTSAVKYNESKALMAAANKEAASQLGRTKLRIHDIIDGSSAPLPQTNKRKADALSDIIENEVRIWGSSPGLDPSTDPMNTTASGSQISALSKLTETDKDPESEIPEQRTVKRLKKVVEGAAYIALGGVGLFSILVATAPDFL